MKDSGYPLTARISPLREHMEMFQIKCDHVIPGPRSTSGCGLRGNNYFASLISPTLGRVSSLLQNLPWHARPKLPLKFNKATVEAKDIESLTLKILAETHHAH